MMIAFFITGGVVLCVKFICDAGSGKYDAKLSHQRWLIEGKQKQERELLKLADGR